MKKEMQAILRAGAAVLVAGGCAPGEVRDGEAAPAGVTALEVPAAAGALAPELAPGRDVLYLTWIEEGAAAPDGAKAHVLKLARWDGSSWSTPAVLASGQDFFANWADRPGAFELDGIVGVHYLKKLGDGTFDYGAALVVSRDGTTWEEAGLVHDDASLVEHGFVSYAAVDGGVQAFWLDGRRMPAGEPMELRTATIGRDGRPGPSTVLDERVCECCDTDAATTSEGPVVVFRGRGDDEVRDVLIARSTPQGWTEPRRVADEGWQIWGCPVNGPAVDAAGERVAVAYFTAAEEDARVRVAFSDDAGASFSAPVTVDGGDPVGRVDLVLADDGSALVSWLGTTDAEGGGEVRLRRVGRDGTLGPVETIAVTTASRRAGVPRMERHGDGLVFAWVEDAEPRRLRLAYRPGL